MAKDLKWYKDLFKMDGGRHEAAIYIQKSWKRWKQQKKFKRILILIGKVKVLFLINNYYF